MSIDQNKDVARRYYEGVWGTANPEVFEQVVHPDITVFYPSLPFGPIHGRERLQRAAAATVATFPDLQMSVDELIAEGDNVVGRWTASGTQEAEFFNIAPTGRSVRWTGLSICRIATGRVIEEWGEEDFSGLLRQLGSAPTTA